MGNQGNNNKIKKKTFRHFIESFKHAVDGFLYVIKCEQNFQIEIVIGAAVIALMYVLEISKLEKLTLWIAIFAVLAMELLNTVLERLVNILIPKVHPYAKVIKDMMAATVLLVSIGALIIGLSIIYPYLKDIFSYTNFF